jgi:hypothetical protein
MNWYYAAAGVLTFVVGLVHSVLGERRIFQKMRKRGLVPTEGGRLLSESNVRILWASWHVLTVFGWGFASILLWLSLPSINERSQPITEFVIIIAMLIGAMFVFVGTKAKHPGWIGLLGVAILVWLGRAS